MNEENEQLIAQIREAFHGVTLGDGIGLWQGQGLDDYETDEVIAAQRERDEKLDWSQIPPGDLNSCSSSLSFFDARGMRFHLPAFLIADLEWTYRQDLVFSLTFSEYDHFEKFALLSAPQREVVRLYLRRHLRAPTDFWQPEIRQALDGFWSEANDPAFEN